MKTPFNLFLLFFTLVFYKNAPAQSWQKIYYENTDSLNFFDIQKDYYREHEKPDGLNGNEERRQEEPGTPEEEFGENESTFFKRWEAYWQNRVYSDGSFPKASTLADERRRYFSNHPRSNLRGNWQPFLHPFATGKGRIDCIAFDPLDSNIVWAGSPTGGLWKSTNGGNSWSTNTDTLESLGISDIVICPTNRNIMFISLGNRDGGDGAKSIGIYKSIDAGVTWQPTALSYPTWSNTYIKKLIMDPTNPDVLYAATIYDGVYKTSDGGTTWNRILIGYFQDIAFQPSNPSTLYVIQWKPSLGTIFRKSTDAGVTFPDSIVMVTSTTMHRGLFATTPADPDYLYLIIANTYDLNGLYLSTNAGASFTLQSNSPNIIGYSCSSPASGSGQGIYDLALCASTVNRDLIYVGGISIWKSANAGVTWSISGCWNYSTPHADQHYLIFSPFNPNKIYAGNDGGINQCIGCNNSWMNITNNMQVMQSYSVSSSRTDATKLMTGTQDNGTHLFRTTASSDMVLDADGSYCEFDYTNDQIMYGSISANVHDIYRSTNDALSFSNVGPSANTTNYAIDPLNPQVLFAYFQRLYKTTNGGTTWPAFTPLDVDYTNFYTRLRFSAGNNAFVFLACRNTATGIFNILKYDTNTGARSIITIPDSVNMVTDIAISNTDINRMWISRNQFGPVKMYQTTDGGVTWTNITGTLPNIPVRKIVYEPNSKDALYIATDLGIFYRDSMMSDWIPWMDGLPNVMVNELEILPGLGKIRAATYGRGIWEATLASATGISGPMNVDPKFIIYPNPTTTDFTITMNTDFRFAKIEIYNVLGEIIRFEEANHATTGKDTKQIHLSAPKGIYFVKLYDKEKQAVQKLIIQ